MDDPKFLDTKSVFKLHSISLQRFGGAEGVRDLSLIESALGAAMNTFHYGNGDLPDIAAAYAFLDGNKRTTVITALTFLEINGVTKTPDNLQLYDALIAIAEKRMDKAGLAELFRSAASMT